MTLKQSLGVSLLIGLVTPAAAQADGMIIPSAGVNFGGNSGHELSTAIDAERFAWVVSLAYMGSGVVGIEGDIAYIPDFFGQTDAGGSSALTAAGNLLLGIPFGGQHGAGIRPYVLAGLGVARSKVDAFAGAPSLDSSKPAWDFGGGVMFFFGTHVGVRADVRYFRTFGDVTVLSAEPRSLEFSRGSTGLIVRF
jgi:opacity protein-like surface antigen